MKRIGNIVRHWLPLALVIVAMSGLVYLVVQQTLRLGANQPQVQMAEDTAAAIVHGESPTAVVPAATVDIETSLAPFMIVWDDNGKVLASSAVLHGQAPDLPVGVLNDVRLHREDRVSWQPGPGVRIAAVVVRVNGEKPGFVLAGRSLREIEQLIDQISRIVIAAALVTLLVALILVSLLELVLPASR
jgi:hypothetical protein